MNVDENPNDSGQTSNDSGIVTEELIWSEGILKPLAEKTLLTVCSPFTITNTRSFTAPSTPINTATVKEGELKRMIKCQCHTEQSIKLSGC